MRTRHGLRGAAASLTVTGATVAVSGCTTGNEPGPTPDTGAISSSASASDAVSNTATQLTNANAHVQRVGILGGQAAQDPKHGPKHGASARIELTAVGMGPADIHVPALTHGRTNRGIIVACTGSGGWKATRQHDGMGWGASSCSIDGAGNVSGPLLNPGKPTIIHLDVAPDSHYWATLYSVAANTRWPRIGG
ncbi:hypothetical protein [Specibacter cremeus]|uniref:hypothetical protein n=1 Tax=Specibacter cremeus TaxID=1629051 RepID=UPI000F786D02|nr:hypothetical protein [Specibacter cremeus]